MYVDASFIPLRNIFNLLSSLNLVSAIDPNRHCFHKKQSKTKQKRRSVFLRYLMSKNDFFFFFFGGGDSVYNNICIILLCNTISVLIILLKKRQLHFVLVGFFLVVDTCLKSLHTEREN